PAAKFFLFVFVPPPLGPAAPASFRQRPISSLSNQKQGHHCDAVSETRHHPCAAHLLPAVVRGARAHAIPEILSRNLPAETRERLWASPVKCQLGFSVCVPRPESFVAQMFTSIRSPGLPGRGPH